MGADRTPEEGVAKEKRGKGKQKRKVECKRRGDKGRKGEKV